jgi:type IV secretion system protein VirD4
MQNPWATPNSAPPPQTPHAPQSPRGNTPTPSANIWGNNGGIYLGYLTDTLEGDDPDVGAAFMYTRDRHIVTFGPNGSGKTRSLLVPNLAGLNDWSIVVIDPKGELCRMTATHRANRGSKIVVLNPFNLFGMTSHGFNPVMALDPESEDFADDALSLADAIIKINPNDREPHWAQSAQDLVTALIMYARLTSTLPDGKGGMIYRGNLGFVRSCLGKKADDFRKIVEAMMFVGNELNCEELYVKAARFADINAENRELNSILSSALTQTRWLDSKPIKKDLEGPTLDFAELKKQPTTVYLILPAQRLATQSPWLRLMIASIMQKLMKDASKPKMPTLLMFDEFAQLGHLSVIENNVALMRGYGVKLWAVFQDLSQAKDIYSQRWESFMGNAGVMNGFAPQDVTTASYMSDRTGKTMVPIVSATASQSTVAVDAHNPSLSFNQAIRPLMLDQELREMDEGFLVAFTHRAKGTVKTFAPFYTELPGMTEIAALDPSL